MQRRKFTSAVLAGLGVWTWTGQAWAFSLSEGDATAGIRAALERGAVSAVGLLGKPDGFL
jgi:hypothetical protein